MSKFNEYVDNVTSYCTFPWLIPVTRKIYKGRSLHYTAPRTQISYTLDQLLHFPVVSGSPVSVAMADCVNWHFRHHLITVQVMKHYD
jgi:hypothetical protein